MRTIPAKLVEDFDEHPGQLTVRFDEQSESYHGNLYFGGARHPVTWSPRIYAAFERGDLLPVTIGERRLELQKADL